MTLYTLAYIPAPEMSLQQSGTHKSRLQRMHLLPDSNRSEVDRCVRVVLAVCQEMVAKANDRRRATQLPLMLLSWHCSKSCRHTSQWLWH
jgi:hypothetical protein